MVRARLFAGLLCLLLLGSSSGFAEGDPVVLAEPLLLEVHDSAPHDDTAYTQGLEFRDGRLFESTGQYGESTLREVDPVTGEVLRSHAFPDDIFAEGLTFVGDEIWVLTWHAGVLQRFAWDTFEPLGNHTYEGEGWGLVFDGEQLFMSNRTSTLTIRNATTFAVEGTLDVTLNGTPLEKVNEMEMWNGLILANVYQTESIVAIDPHSGVVVLVIDASGLRPEGGKELNGIAWDATTDSLWITGKDWSQMVNVSFLEPPRYPGPVAEEPTAPEPVDTPMVPWLLGLLVFADTFLLAAYFKDIGRESEPAEGEG